MLTLKERDEFQQRDIFRVSLPFLHDEGVTRLKHRRIGIAIDQDNLPKVAIQARQVLLVGELMKETSTPSDGPLPGEVINSKHREKQNSASISKNIL